jgi:enediyne biosynthesis protein E4
MMAIQHWPGFPASRHDPRLAVAAILFCYLILGLTVLGFNRSPQQIGITITSAVLLEMLFYRVLVGGWVFPLSAFITGMGLSILINYAHGYVLALLPPLFAIGSKYLFTLRGRHVYNPALFGVVACLLLTNGMISDSPAYQWGGSYAIAAFIITLALFGFVLRIQRMALIVSFLIFYSIGLSVRAWLTRWHMPMETWILGAATTPTLYLFVFFMITDPQTSPASRKGQIFVAFALALVDFILHLKESLSTFFYAAFLVTSLRFIWFQGQALRTGGWPAVSDKFKFGARRWGILGAAAGLGWGVVLAFTGGEIRYQPEFELRAIDSAAAGMQSRQGQVLNQVDPRLAHIAKWMLSVGDAVAVADIDNDGLQDFFVSYPLKDSRDRAALYRNLGNAGNVKFERVALPELTALYAHPETNGLPSGAMFFDYDNDGDQDLLVLTGYGKTRLFKNLLLESGKLGFIDVSAEMGLNDYTISIAANAADYNHDGKLDLIIANVMSPTLLAYDTNSNTNSNTNPPGTPPQLNIFKLPQPEYVGDRRMFDFMHRTWHNANNGGGIHLLHNQGAAGFTKIGIEKLDLVGESRWTTTIGFGDLSGDGWPDIYTSNDFGPDQLLINQRNGQFKRVRGNIIGQIGHDTYKGMNVTFADFDNNGFNDIYVSNVHEKLQAEGSLLWMNNGHAEQASNWQDRAMANNALNEKRFGWGAAAGDIDLDGKVDILQANGMVDNAYDPLYPGCPDYWYWNDKIALTRPDIHGMADRWADLRGRCIFASEKNRVYLHRGQHFLDVAEQVGWREGGTSRGVALVDLDNDGRLDVLVTHQFAPLSIYHNLAKAGSGPKRWLGLTLQGNGQSCNRDAIGSRVEISTPQAGGHPATQWREVLTINGFSAQNDRRLLFGLGEIDSANPADGLIDVRIYWCGQNTPQRLQLPGGRYHTLVQGRTP